MYRSNQTRIKNEISPLLPGHRQTPRGRLSLTLAALAVNSTHVYCSVAGTVARQPPSLPSPLPLNPPAT